MKIINQLDNKYIGKRKIKLKSSLNGDFSYINALILCLSNIPDLLLFLQNNISFINNPQKIPLTFSFFREIDHLYSNSSENEINVQDSSSIIKIIEHCFPFLKTNKNPIDLFILLMNDIDDELNDDKRMIIPNDIDKRDLNGIIKYKTIFFNNNKSIITQIFNSFYKKEFKCLECNNTFYEIQNFFTFDLDPINTYKKYNKNILTINDCLTNYVSPTTSKFICTICNKSSKFAIIKNIFSPSNNLVFVLNRNNSEQESIMLKIKLNYEETLDISYFIDKKSAVKNPQYILIAVVAYSFDKKKFVAFCKNLAVDEWIYFDDDLINQCNYNYMVNNSTPYLLFYKMLG